ncbi:hypothetical protein PMAYCL1PPCAC_25908, partial [Pristionchus mayeri]
ERKLKEETEERTNQEWAVKHMKDFATHIENENKKMEVELRRLKKESETFRNKETGRPRVELELANEKTMKGIDRLLGELRSGELSNMKLEELEAENRRLNERLDEAKIHIESLDGEKSKLEQELTKRISDSNLFVSQWEEPMKIEEQYEALKMTE